MSDTRSTPPGSAWVFFLATYAMAWACFIPVAVAFPGGTLLEAVNAVVRERQDLWWELGYGNHGPATFLRLSSLVL